MPATKPEQFVSRLVLGTAQWGMNYGIANQQGMPSDEELRAMFAQADQQGVRTLDTASAYGHSEERIGTLLGGAPGWRVITKLTPELAKYGRAQDDVVKAAAESLAHSREKLQVKCLDSVLLHRAEHLQLAEGAVWRFLRAQQDGGQIKQLGVSATTPQEALLALDVPGVQLIQVAGSLFDRRLVRPGFFEQAKERGIEVFLRSVFLQGVAFMQPGELPVYLDVLTHPLANVRNWAASRDLDVEEIFLRYIAGYGVGLVVGCENRKQLSALLQAAKMGAFEDEEMKELERLVPELPDSVLDPWRWPKRI